MGRLTEAEERQIHRALYAQQERLGHLARQLDDAETGPYSHWDRALLELAATLRAAAKEISAMRVSRGMVAELFESLPRGDAEWKDLAEEPRVALAAEVARQGWKLRYEWRLLPAAKLRWAPRRDGVVLTADLSTADSLQGSNAVIASPRDGGWEVAVATAPAARWLKEGVGRDPLTPGSAPPGVEVEQRWSCSRFALAIWQAAIESALRGSR